MSDAVESPVVVVWGERCERREAARDRYGALLRLLFQPEADVGADDAERPHLVAVPR